MSSYGVEMLEDLVADAAGYQIVRYVGRNSHCHKRTFWWALNVTNAECDGLGCASNWLLLGMMLMKK